MEDKWLIYNLERSLRNQKIAVHRAFEAGRFNNASDIDRLISKTEAKIQELKDGQ